MIWPQCVYIITDSVFTNWRDAIVIIFHTGIFLPHLCVLRNSLAITICFLLFENCTSIFPFLARMHLPSIRRTALHSMPFSSFFVKRSPRYLYSLMFLPSHFGSGGLRKIPYCFDRTFPTPFSIYFLPWPRTLD